MITRMVRAFAEFERAMLRERTKAGLEAGRGDGRIGGRCSKPILRQRTEIIRTVFRGSETAAETGRLFSARPAVSHLLAGDRQNLRPPRKADKFGGKFLR